MHIVSYRYVLLYCYISLYIVAYRFMPLYTVTYIVIYLSFLIYRYISLYTFPYRYTLHIVIYLSTSLLLLHVAGCVFFHSWMCVVAQKLRDFAEEKCELRGNTSVFRYRSRNSSEVARSLASSMTISHSGTKKHATISQLG